MQEASGGLPAGRPFYGRVEALRQLAVPAIGLSPSLRRALAQRYRGTPAG
jgi:hypothetical protein